MCFYPAPRACLIAGLARSPEETLPRHSWELAGRAQIAPQSVRDQTVGWFVEAWVPKE